MSPKRLPTRSGDRAQALARRSVAAKYLEVSDLIANEDGPSVNVCVGLSVLAGIAAGDAICMNSIGEHHSGTDHVAAAELLSRVDSQLGKRLRRLINLKSLSHYGDRLLTASNRDAALKDARALVSAANERT